ncbi:dnaJ homolog subfamily C member 3 [Cimex lectularius]|uniref:J domain-containing protein n=1 Tax=Cimex lectularius TaxID=79782 RepID=A0A8I6RHS5_CIMLE|nr:dnaJ homolog subfamily C member 3 [Cimex lectularius]
MEYWQASTSKLNSAWIVLFAVDLFLGGTKGTSQEEVRQHLALGGDLLARGQLQDALSHFHAAVEGDPRNYLTYFKRGTVYLALGKAKFAISDFNRVLELKPDFTGARHQRAMVYFKEGSLDEAKEDFLYIYQQENNGDAYNNYVRTQNIQTDIAHAQAYMNSEDYGTAVDLLSKIIEVCPWSSYLRELRSQCYVALNDPLAAILDLRSTTKLIPDNTEGFFKLAILHYQLGQAAESLKESRDCLKLDPEHKDCFPHYKKVKKIDKFFTDAQNAFEREDFETCITNANKVLKTEEKVPMIRFTAYSKLAGCYLKNNQPSESISACSSALDISRDPEVLCDRAEAYIAMDMFDEAMRDYHEVLDRHEGYPRAKEGIQKAQKLQKQSEKRDYYKILGVKRTATKKEITKAYRKAAQQWHPDNFPEGPEKKKAEKKFIDIAAAKEVLTNEEKRSKFDNGEDPLDPESGNHDGFNPFQQFHQFHGGTPFTFRFHFN